MMKVLFIIPGAGDNFYCGNCFRDNLYASALRKAGHDVIISPLYLPLKHRSFQSNSPLFFPATTYYLAHKYFKNSKIPAVIERVAGSAFMLNYAASKAGTTSPKGLEGMTLSMINGEDAAFQTEISRMADWIKTIEKPDIIHLSSSLLIGIAKFLREKLEIPMVCSLQDEEVWIDEMDDTYANLAWQQIAENTRYVDKLIATSNYYRSIAEQKIGKINAIEVVYPGFEEEKYANSPELKEPVIGFFYRMNEKNGLHILVDAFVRLKQKNAIPGLKLKVGGGFNAQDKKYLKELQNKLSAYRNDVEFSEGYSLDDHKAFYQSISVISVPITFDEGIGLYLCEAFAAGVPAVVPETGSIPEIVTDAGILYHPNTPELLADALEQALTNQKKYNELKHRAKQLGLTRYNAAITAEKLYELYENIVNKKY